MGLLHTISVVLGAVMIGAAVLTAMQLLGVSVPINLLGHEHGALYDWGFFVLSLSLGTAMLLHAFQPTEVSLRRLFDLMALAGLVMMLISGR
ncbi:hypothetical protein KJ819_02880 [Patescibacteria group bacterium]|nr:hypothetical protein [Patescibacteria group bacterium]MBU1500779.1 hypothetical protein [Patescibacteria group bacterium]MBU2080834.1 hypothetical protein [Patescibacteria group bacterium]MBU2123939.1 hypothetical protein [Patescibacteria group bacterium]MBU2194770.1 hypothetical protein [Patescibacteria group bacterium]